MSRVPLTLDEEWVAEGVRTSGDLCHKPSLVAFKHCAGVVDKKDLEFKAS
jgi:hypothetical protein